LSFLNLVRRGGGVALYISENITSYEPADACYRVSKLEQVWAVVVTSKSKSLIGCIYRPNDFSDLDEIRMVLSNAKYYVDIRMVLMTY